MMGRGGAGVAAPCDDGSAMFFNPAGLAVDMKPVFSVGVTGIAPRGTFTDSTTSLVSTLNAQTYAAPAAYAAVPLGQRVMIGAGLFALYGLTTDWPPASQGRYLGYYSSLKSFYVQPTVAFRVSDNVMIGGGVDITHTTADLRQRLDLSTQTLVPPLTFGTIGVPRGTDFADVKLTGSGNKIGAHVGAIVRANDRFSVGARYLTRQTVSIDNGDLTATQIPTNLRTPVPLPGLPAGTPIDALVGPAFASGARLGPQSATTTVPLPDQFVAGIAAKATDSLSIFADYQYVHWQMFDVLEIVPQNGAVQVTPENYGNTSGFRLGVEHRGPAIIRLGFDTHNAAAPDESVTPRLPEGPRWELAGGIGIPAGPHARFDFAYLYVHQQDRTGRTGDLPNNGTYHYYANLFSGSFVVTF